MNQVKIINIILAVCFVFVTSCRDGKSDPLKKLKKAHGVLIEEYGVYCFLANNVSRKQETTDIEYNVIRQEGHVVGVKTTHRKNDLILADYSLYHVLKEANARLVVNIYSSEIFYDNEFRYLYFSSKEWDVHGDAVVKRESSVNPIIYGSIWHCFMQGVPLPYQFEIDLIKTDAWRELDLSPITNSYTIWRDEHLGILNPEASSLRKKLQRNKLLH